MLSRLNNYFLVLSFTSRKNTIQPPNLQSGIYKDTFLAFFPVVLYVSPASKSDRFSVCLSLLSPVADLYPEGDESDTLGILAGISQMEKEQMLNTDE